jgi:hypothetical protein
MQSCADEVALRVKIDHFLNFQQLFSKLASQLRHDRLANDVVGENLP